ncbi:DUF2612 domain-containing protein [Pantoea agglomerans]|uniref:DUF2612 domain-containing protein n=1 Tax=Enterobacter agglomerans TaxID=549 RepID=A0ACC5PWK3_ENTAG|nr:DUF2612 domain-containing protein [Pantoea agglomerans]MBD8129239.1 DUF2612 domain-containing protein [Pantoea agglomerans]MBD8156427.1 DUF2612 domain-containing protein [Pantoea agglomerans]WVL84652.1 DUF2612 domain-containing protein [Pantoea agglomerans]
MTGYADLLISQYVSKPKARATVQALADDMAQSFTGALSVPDMLDIEHAGGVNLDIIGKITGQDRVLNGAVAREFFAFKGYQQTQGFQVSSAGGSPWYRHGDTISASARLSDTEMRTLIKARCIKNFSPCTMDDLERSCELLFGRDGYEVDIDVNTPCVWQITTFGADQFVLFCAKSLDVLPRASGMNYTFVEK